MDKDEAQAIGAAQLSELRARLYAELRERLLDRSETIQVIGSSGARYQVERQALLDGPGENLRVMVSVDDGGPQAFAPMTDDFIVKPTGHVQRRVVPLLERSTTSSPRLPGPRTFRLTLDTQVD
jgi:hypothetical protein